MALDNSNNTYTVQEGDTLSGLFGQNWQEVAAFNGIDDPTKLQVGQEIDLNLYEPQPIQQQIQQEQPSGEEGFLSGAADWASSYFKEVGADTRDVYEDLSSGMSSLGNDVYSTFGNSPMPQTLEELGSPEEGSEEGIGTLEDYEDVTVGDWAGGAPAETPVVPAPVEQAGEEYYADRATRVDSYYQNKEQLVVQNNKSKAAYDLKRQELKAAHKSAKTPQEKGRIKAEALALKLEEDKRVADLRVLIRKQKAEEQASERQYKRKAKDKEKVGKDADKFLDEQYARDKKDNPHGVIVRKGISAALTNVSKVNSKLYENMIRTKGAQYGLDTPQSLRRFLATTAVETGDRGFAASENLDYSLDNLLRGSRNARNDKAEARRVARVDGHPANQEGVANLRYANMNGNGDRASGDGWKFRGMGAIQLTGRANYAAVGALMGMTADELADNREDKYIQLEAAMAYWKLNELDKPMTMDETTDIVNPHTPSRGERQTRFDNLGNVFNT